MRRENGGVIGSYVNTNTTTAAGRWGLNAAADRVARLNTGGSKDVWPQAKDASFSSVTLCSHLVDMSADAYKNTGSAAVGPVLFGSATPSDAQVKFQPSSIRNSSSFSGACINVASNAGFNYGTGDFTFEFWTYPLLVSLANVWDQRTASNSACPNIYVTGTGDLRYFVSNADRITGGTNAIVVNAWQHIAVCRSATTTKMFVNGTQVGSNYTDSVTYTQGQISMGNSAQNVSIGNAVFSSYWSEVRVTKGVARYTSNFTAPTAPFPDY